jgi:hypothetical protein
MQVFWERIRHSPAMVIDFFRLFVDRNDNSVDGVSLPIGRGYRDVIEELERS